MIFEHTNELKISDISNADTNQTENHQDKGATPPLGTHPSLINLPLEDTLVALSKTLSRPRVNAGEANLQLRAGDLPDVRFLGSNYILFGVYQDWVHQNPGIHLDGGIT